MFFFKRVLRAGWARGLVYLRREDAGGSQGSLSSSSCQLCERYNGGGRTCDVLSSGVTKAWHWNLPLKKKHEIDEATAWVTRGKASRRLTVTSARSTRYAAGSAKGWVWVNSCKSREREREREFRLCYTPACSSSRSRRSSLNYSIF